MSADLNTFVEFCPQCHASMTLKSYALPFATNVARAYHNLSRNDAFALESGLPDLSAESAALAVEIQRMEILLPTLKKHRAHLDYHIRQTRAYTTHSPIRQLPTEILTLVFAFACTSYEPEYHKTPLSISLVCFKWRDIAMAAPRLWTNIYIGGSGPEARALFRYYLERCGELPILLKIDTQCIQHCIRKGLSDAADAGITLTPDECASVLAYKYDVECMHEIYSTFRRWKAVEFHVGEEDLDLLDDHTTKEGLGLPLLESLTLAPIKPVRNFGPSPSAFQNVPRLTYLDLNEDGGWLWINCGLPTNISELHTNRDKLEWLAALNRSFADSKEGTSTLVVYPRTFLLSTSITHIVFNTEFWTMDFKRFLELASIPGLKALTIVAPDPADTDGREKEQSWANVLEAVPKLLETSKCTLESFNLTMHGRYRAQHVCLAAPMAQTLVQALQAMPKLQSLTVIEAISGPPLLTELIPGMTDHCHPHDSLMAMLSSRVGDGGGTLGLSSVVLGRRNGCEFMPAVLDHLRELRKSGVRASLW
ncbi:hypothetical protein BDZ89DRAFT_1067220 [Hymenopellis radicata]|nr:hypothetical protein BDZ89DRAFT_1067220 [Hymenopellis radicata]